jgi:hypothetical protein
MTGPTPGAELDAKPSEPPAFRPGAVLNHVAVRGGVHEEEFQLVFATGIEMTMCQKIPGNPIVRFSTDPELVIGNTDRIELFGSDAVGGAPIGQVSLVE